jgi:hypothetical protein
MKISQVTFPTFIFFESRNRYSYLQVYYVTRRNKDTVIPVANFSFYQDLIYYHGSREKYLTIKALQSPQWEDITQKNDHIKRLVLASLFVPENAIYLRSEE